jgi:AraC-like DNA-binding protein
VSPSSAPPPPYDLTGGEISIRVLGLLLACAPELSPPELLLAAGVTHAQLLDINSRVPRETWVRLTRLIVEKTGDLAIGLHAAEHVAGGPFGVVDYLLRNCPTLGDLYARVARYARLVTDAATLTIHRGPARARLVLAFSPDSDRLDGFVRRQLWTASLVIFGRRRSGVDFAPLEVCYDMPQTADTAEYERIFRSPIHFDREQTEIVLPVEVLGTILAGADPGLGLVLEGFADGLLAKLPASGELVERLRSVIVRMLRDGEPTVAGASRRLALSSRTLQRRLREGGITFQQVVDDVRRASALRWLEDPAISISEVAFLLGFTKPSAFHRAFKRWTHTTPGDYRRGRVGR